MQIHSLDYGVNISNINLENCSDSQLEDIIDICTKEHLVILRDQKMSLERFDKINDVFGIHKPLNIWANHKNFPKIIRVTNKEIEQGLKGFLSEHKIDWHCEGVFIPDPEECLLLWCMEPGADSTTHFACGVHAYNSLDRSIKEEIEKASIVLTSRVPETYMKKGVIAYGSFLQNEKTNYDTYLNQIKSRNNNIKVNTKENNGRNEKIQKPLVVTHPISDQKGLYFPLYFVSEIINLKNPSRAKAIFHTLVNSYIGSQGRFHKHRWRSGDLILSDQIHSLHRRDTYSGMRELYRTIFWYHDSNKMKSPVNSKV